MSGEDTYPRVEPGIGRSLERARQSKGLSLKEVEQRTKIRSRYLRDLEREEFDVLPAVYVLGSLKTYADFLGLDGAALSGQLKARLTEPETQTAVPADAHEDEREGDEFEAAPVPAVGFDQLFLGMGVILISILAIMTLAAAVAQGDRSPVSQVDQPSTPEPPSEVALAGDTQEQEVGEDGASQNGEDGPEEDPEASKVSGDEDRDASRATSPLGDAEFVPMSPSSGSAGTPSTASATSAASASAAPASATAKPETAKSESRPSSPAPATPEASSRPAAENRTAASAPAPAPPSNAPAPAPARSQGAGQPSPPASGAGPIPAEAARMIDETFRLNGP